MHVNSTPKRIIKGSIRKEAINNKVENYKNKPQKSELIIKETKYLSNTNSTLRKTTVRMIKFDNEKNNIDRNKNIPYVL